MIENLVLVEETAQGDDYIFTGDARRENASECKLDNVGHLPPRSACGPDTSGVGPYNGGPLKDLISARELEYSKIDTHKAGYTPVHVRVAVTRNSDCFGPCVSYRTVNQSRLDRESRGHLYPLQPSTDAQCQRQRDEI